MCVFTIKLLRYYFAINAYLKNRSVDNSLKWVDTMFSRWNKTVAKSLLEKTIFGLPK